MLDARAVMRYGASYSPLIFPESEWEADLRQIQAAGMNLIRIGDVHGSWDRLEPQEGHIRLEIIDSFYRRAHAYGLDVLLSTGASCPPLWLAHKYPDAVILSSRGERYPLAASYHWACIHHPGFLEACDRYLAALAQFAVGHENHFGWQISNEIGFPFNPTREKDRIDLYCYCEHSKARFREWVRAKYHTLEALNAAWIWSTTAFWYNDWEEVDPPEATPEAWSGVTRWLDWRLFWQEAFAEFARRQHDLIRRYDPDHPTSLNTFNFKGYDRFGALTGLDQWQLAKQVDHIGYDLYPGSGAKIVSRTEHTSIFLDHGRSVSRWSRRDFWLHEVESGPIGGWVLGPEYNTGPADIRRNGLEALGHDAKLMIYMPWREWDYQPLHWGALVDLEGQPTSRLEAATELGRYIQRNNEHLLTAHVPPGEVALLESKPNAIFFNGIGQEETLFAAQRGAYRVFWEQDFSVDFITPAHLSQPEVANYSVIVLPLMALLSLEQAEALSAYVKGGGLLIGFARCASLTETGWYHRRLPIPPLREAFGLTHIEPDALGPSVLELAGQQVQGTLHRDLVQPEPATEVLAHFVDGWPAITLAQRGRGAGLYIATRADAGYLKPEGAWLKSLLAGMLERFKIRPRVCVSYQQKGQRTLDQHLLEGVGRSTLLIANYLKEDTSCTLRIQRRGRMPERVEMSLDRDGPTDWSLEGDELLIHCSPRSERSFVIDIFWQTGR
jgi:beta-galactosidase GanA